jgi:hypothetical protein
LFNFLHSPVTSSLLGPNILLSTLFSTALLRRNSTNAYISSRGPDHCVRMAECRSEPTFIGPRTEDSFRVWPGYQ